MPISPSRRLAVPVRLRALAAAGALLALTASSHHAQAAPDKDECIAAHGQGQDLQEKGQLADARALFLTCAQSACPAMVQADCTRFAEEVGRLVPSVTFAARDARGGDIPDTSVRLDDKLVTSRLDEGKSFEVNPGKHTVRFSHEGKEVVQQVVINQGERGRVLVATFGAAATAPDAPGAPGAPPAPIGTAPPPASRSAAPLVLAGIGGAVVLAGGVLLLVGKSQIPSNCSLSSHDCAAPPDDASFGKARSAVGLMNAGGVVGGVGAAALAGGLVWYFTQSPAPAARTGQSRWSPWLAPGLAGLSLSGSL
jgi:hypothetical protein